MESVVLDVVVVGVEVVEVEEERPVALLREPRDGAVADAIGVHAGPVDRTVAVVRREPLREPEDRLDEVVADEGRVLVAGRGEALREELRVGRDGRREVGRAVQVGQQPGEQRRGRRQRPRRRPVDALEPLPARGEPVEVRRRLARVAVAAEPVGAQRVDADEQDVRRAFS
jgi:hypothetical protein